MINQLKLLLFILLVASISSASDFQSPRTAALGGAGHAGPLNADAIYLNPSYVSLVQIYAVGLNYYTYSGESPNPTDYHGMGYNASIQDGRSDLFQAGVGYTERQDAQLLNFGASKQFVDKLGTGIGGKYYHPRNGSGDSFWDSMISSTYVISNSIQTAAIVDNIAQSDLEKKYGFYREIIAASKFNIEKIVILYFDPHLAPDASTPWGFEGGFELPVFTDFYLRGGMFKQSSVDFVAARGNGYGLGLGWIAPRISFDYGYQHVVAPVGAYQHIFGVTFLL